ARTDPFADHQRGHARRVADGHYAGAGEPRGQAVRRDEPVVALGDLVVAQVDLESIELGDEQAQETPWILARVGVQEPDADAHTLLAPREHPRVAGGRPAVADDQHE